MLRTLMLRTQRAGVSLLLLNSLLLSGCVGGALYQKTVRPLDTNMRQTPILERDGGAGDVFHLSIPVGGARIDILWNSNAIGDIAKRHGINEVHYADLETFNVLGIWRSFTVHVYGR